MLTAVRAKGKTASLRRSEGVVTACPDSIKGDGGTIGIDTG